ncbi:MAG: hypothetical protein BYD32DRAFT_440092 [Podila humilis]|nr:MAG: hypothetical protein BYD32DRAFT_440092 [Podila humilis]
MLDNNDNNINNINNIHNIHNQSFLRSHQQGSPSTPSSLASTPMTDHVAQDMLQCIVDSVIQDGMDSACCQELIPHGMIIELPENMPDPLEAFIRRTSGIVTPILETPSPSCSSSSSMATPLVACCTGFNAQCSSCGDASSTFSSSSQASQSRKAPPSSISLISHEQPFMVGHSPPITTPGINIGEHVSLVYPRLVCLFFWVFVVGLESIEVSLVVYCSAHITE